MYALSIPRTRDEDYAGINEDIPIALIDSIEVTSETSKDASHTICKVHANGEQDSYNVIAEVRTYAQDQDQK